MHVLSWVIILSVFASSFAQEKNGRKLIKVVKVRPLEPEDGQNKEHLGGNDPNTKFGDRVGSKTRRLDLTSFKSVQVVTSSAKPTAAPTTTRRTDRTTATTLQEITSSTAPLTPTLSTGPSTETTTRANTEAQPRLLETTTLAATQQQTEAAASTTTSKKTKRLKTKSTTKTAKTKKKRKSKKVNSTTTIAPTTLFIDQNGLLDELSASEERELEEIDFDNGTGETEASTPFSIPTTVFAVSDSIVSYAPVTTTTSRTTRATSRTSTLPRKTIDNTENVALLLGGDILKESRNIKTEISAQTEPRLSNQIFVFERPPSHFSTSLANTLPGVTTYSQAAIISTEGVTKVTVQHPVSSSGTTTEKYGVSQETNKKDYKETSIPLPTSTTYHPTFKYTTTTVAPTTTATRRPTTTAIPTISTTPSTTPRTEPPTRRTTKAATQAPKVAGDNEANKQIDILVLASKFSCADRAEGYYADTDTDCQVWHWCTPGDRKFTFTCPDGTKFNQKHQVCDWRKNVDCSKAEAMYDESNKKENS